MSLRRLRAASRLVTLMVAAAGPWVSALALDPGEALRLSQAAMGRQVGDYRLTTADGAKISVGALRGRPLVVSYIYTSCGFVCPTITTQLARVVGIARETLGADSFAVLTVGFDTRVDTPAQMARYAAERGIADPLWYFASGEASVVEALARDIGFAYAPAAGGFDHLAQVTILDAGGRVYRQLYGPEFEPPALVDPLKRLALGLAPPDRPLAAFIDKVRLLCTSYDPKSGRYRFDYSLLLEIAIGLSCTIGVGIFVLRAWRQGGNPNPRGT